MGLILPFLLRSTLVIAGALLLAAALRRQPKAARLVLRVALVMLPFLLLLSPHLPRGILNLPLIPDVQGKMSVLWSSSEPAPQAPLDEPFPPPAREVAEGEAAGPWPRGPSGPELLWLGVSGALLASTGLGILRLALMKRRASKASIAEVNELAQEVGGQAPMTLRWEGALPFVALAPGRTLFVPQDWEARITPEARSHAIRHELAHLSNRDLEYGLLGRGVLALCWIQPLVLLILSRLSDLIEHIADDEVLNRGVLPADYARSLAELQMSRRRELPRFSFSVVSRSRGLKSRVARILDSSRSQTLTRGGQAGAFCAACLLAAASFSLGVGQAPDEPGGRLDMRSTREVSIFDSDGQRLMQGKAYAAWSNFDLVHWKHYRVPLKFENGMVTVPVKKNNSHVYLVVVREDGSLDYDLLWPRTKSLSNLTLRAPMTSLAGFEGPDGSPAVGVSVILDASRSQRQKGIHLALQFECIWPGKNLLKTDSRGQIALKGLPYGSSVTFRPTDEFTVLVDSAHGDTYNGRSKGRQDVKVVEGGVVEGQVIYGGKHAAEAFLHGFQHKKKGEIGSPAPFTAIADKKGRFRLTNLLPLVCSVTGSLGSAPRVHSQSVSLLVRPGEVTRAPDIVIPQAVRVEGSLIVDQGRQLGALRVIATEMGQANYSSGEASPGPGGRFALWLAPGSYQFHVNEATKGQKGKTSWKLASGCRIDLTHVGPGVKVKVLKEQSTI